MRMTTRLARRLAQVAALTGLVAAFPGEAAPAVDLELHPLVSGLSFPVAIAHAGDGSGRLFIAEQAGRIVVYDGATGTLAPTPFLDISPLVGFFRDERGLLGLAFHPSYESNGYFYVNYTNLQGTTIVARYQVSGDPDAANAASAATLLVVPQPFSNHNGGQLQFGPDGYLYIGLGDGGGGGDPLDNGENPSTLLGSILRLDVDGGAPYGIPPDNPFVGDPTALDEIWAFGLRNPWRFSFDRLTGDLFIGDVGQNQWEEVSFQLSTSPGGENYGWDFMEGTHCFEPSTNCNDGSLVLPILEYGHALGCSVTAGYLYRGARLPSLYGKYVYGDFCSGRIWAATESAGTWTPDELFDTSFLIATFGEDEEGEIYVASYTGSSGGTLYRFGSSVTVLFEHTSTALSEGDTSTPVSVQVETSGGGALPEPVTVEVASLDGSATAGSDYNQVMETVSFPMGAPSGSTESVSVSPIDDAIDEPLESFTLRLSSPSGAGIGAAIDHGVTLADDDPPPTLTVGDVTVAEGNCAVTDAVFDLALTGPSGFTIAVDVATGDLTTTASADYTPRSTTVTFSPGVTERYVAVSVRGDLKDETDEQFTLTATNPVNVTLADPVGEGTIVDDDTGVFLSNTEIAHGTVQLHDLAALPGPAADEDWFRIGQSPYASYEVLVDDLSSDLGGPAAGLSLDRLACGAASVLQQSVPVALGSARSLRWENAAADTALEELIRVRSGAGGCTDACGTDDVYRIRAVETTLAASRFNNVGQLTIVMLQNAASVAVTGHVWLWDVSGEMAASQSFALSPRGTFVLNTATIAAGASGSVTVTHDGPHGSLTGKAVALEPATGFTFDTPLLSRPR